MRKYSAILGNLGNTRDRFCSGYKNNPSQKEMLRKAAAIDGIKGIEYIELLYWLDVCGYDGWFSMDQYPYREDAAGAIGESMKWLKAFDSIMSDNRSEIKKVITDGDAVASSSLLREIMFKQLGKVR